MRTEKGYISKKSGMGGFLNPPTHPEHFYRVTGKDFSTSLSAAATTDWLNDETKQEAQNILNAWKKPPLDSADVQDWIRQVMGYFKSCYVGQDQNGDKSWNADKLRINKDADPVLNQDIHAGVHFIREWYPEFVLTKEIIDGAYWGTKP